MKVFTSRVVVCAIMSFVAIGIAYADIPAADYKTLTSKAYVDSMVSDSNVSGNKINGVALSTGGYFYGVEDSSDTGTTATRKVSIPNVTELSAGLMIIVKPIVDAAYANNTNAAAAKLQLNNFEAKVMRYNGAVLTTTTDGYAWKNGFPAIWVYDGTYWNYAGGYDANTTYSTMSVSEGRTATATDQRVMTAAKLKGIVHGLTLSNAAAESGTTTLSLNTSLTGTISTSDTILSALGRLQGQITNLSSTVSNIPDYGNNLVNGAPIKNESSTFVGYDESAPNEDKKVRIESIAKQDDGIIIVVQPKYTSTKAESKLQLNDFEPAQMLYMGAPVTVGTAEIVWNGNYPSTWVYNKSIPAWIFAGNGYDARPDISGIAGSVSDLASHKVNGAPLSNANSVFFGTSNSAADDTVKVINVPSITALEAGTMVTVLPKYDAGRGISKIQLNSFAGFPAFYMGQEVGDETAKKLWSAKYPSTWAFDGSGWYFVGYGNAEDNDTTYGEMNDSASGANSGPVGTGTTSLLVSPKVLKNTIHGVNLTANSGRPALDTTQTGAITTSDTVIGALGKAQGQINDLKDNKINGVSLADGGFFWGTSSSAADATQKDVTASNIPSTANQNPPTGLIIAIKPSATSTAGSSTLKLNNFNAKTMRRNNANLDATYDGYVWNSAYPTFWVFDGTYWQYLGGYDYNTTYSTLSVSEGRTATATNQRVVTAKKLKGIVHGLTLASVATDETGVSALSLDTSTTTTEIATTDTIIGALGKLQGQIRSLSTTVGGLEYLEWDANNTTTQTTATDAYSITFDSSTNNWPETDSGKIVTGLSLAKGLQRKQNRLAATSTGDAAPVTGGGQAFVANTLGSPNTRYIAAGYDEALTAKSGADEVQAYMWGNDISSSNGLTATQVEQSLVSLKTLKGVYDELEGEIPDLSTYKINGVPVSSGGFFWGTSDTAAGTAQKDVTASNIPSTAGQNPPTGIIIAIKPSATSTVANSTIKLNDFNAKAMRRNNAAITTSTDSIVWNQNYPTFWVFDGTYWQYLGGWDQDTTYYTMNALTNPSAGSQTYGNGIAGTSTYNNVISPRILKNVIHNTNLTANAAITGENLGTFNPTNSAITASDTVIGAFGKAQGQIDSLSTSVSGLEHGIEDTGASDEHIAHDAVPIPDALAYTELTNLRETGQLFWLPSLKENGNEAANHLLKEYSLSGRKVVPTMDALAYALDGVVQTRENTSEWQMVASYYRLPIRNGVSLAMVADLIERQDPNAIRLNRSGYLQTFAPTLEALMTESSILRQDLSAYADSTATNAARLRQNKIPNTGYIRTSNTATTATAINNSGTNSWGSANVKGAGLVTKTTTDGVVGERSIIDTDTDTTSWTTDRKNLAIPSMAKVEAYAQKKKVCAEYAPGTTQSNQSAATCWLWTLAD